MLTTSIDPGTSKVGLSIVNENNVADLYEVNLNLYVGGKITAGNVANAIASFIHDFIEEFSATTVFKVEKQPPIATSIVKRTEKEILTQLEQAFPNATIIRNDPKQMRTHYGITVKGSTKGDYDARKKLSIETAMSTFIHTSERIRVKRAFTKGNITVADPFDALLHHHAPIQPPSRVKRIKIMAGQREHFRQCREVRLVTNGTIN